MTALIAKEKEVSDNLEDLYKPLLKELLILRKDGITLANGKNIQFDTLYDIGDNLELNNIGGFQSHFHSGYPSRQKKITMEQIRNASFMIQEIDNRAGHLRTMIQSLVHHI